MTPAICKFLPFDDISKWLSLAVKFQLIEIHSSPNLRWSCMQKCSACDFSPDHFELLSDWPMYINKYGDCDDVPPNSIIVVGYTIGIYIGMPKKCRCLSPNLLFLIILLISLYHSVHFVITMYICLLSCYPVTSISSLSKLVETMTCDCVWRSWCRQSEFWPRQHLKLDMSRSYVGSFRSITIE